MTYPTGIKFPFRFSATGGVQRAEAGDKVMSDLSALVKSALEERLIRKAVGTVGYTLILRSNVTQNAGLVEQLVFEAIVRWIPAISNLSVRVYEKEIDTGIGIFADVVFKYLNTGEVVDDTLRLDE